MPRIHRMEANVLVINEDSDLSNVIRMILENEGYNVICSLNFFSLEELDKIKPKLIIVSDWVDRGSSRYYCHNLKLNTATKSIPVILTSVESGLEERFGTYGADDFITFPFELGKMIAKVRSYIES